MVRLETSTHFWTAEQDGAVVTRRAGRSTHKGRASKKTWRSAAAARHALREQVRAKIDEGYALVTAEPAAESPDDALALDDLGRDEAVLVYGDWLQGRGDPRGELVTLQHAMQNARGEAFVELRAEVGRVFKAHRQAFLGVIAEIENLYELQWRLGFIQEARVVADRSGRVRDVIARLFGKTNQSRLLEHLTTDLLELESSRFLETLSLESVGGRDFAGVLATVERLAPRTLRRLVIPLSRHLEASLSVLKKVDDVRGAQLQQRLGEYADAAIELGAKQRAWPHLRELVVKAPIGFSGDVPGLELLASCDMPNLEAVELNCTARRTSAEQLAAFLEPKRFPKLSSVRFHHAWFARELCRMLVDSPMASQLVEIDLSWGRLDDRTAVDVARARRRFPKLKRFIIHSTDVSNAVRKNLRNIGLDIDLQVPDEEEDITEARVVSLCVDERVEAEGRALAHPNKWQDLGHDRFRMWGRVYAGGLHSVIVGLPALRGSCDCMSRKKPCKHILAMLFLAARDEVPEGKLPSWLY